MNLGGFVIANAVSGMIGGAIGAASASGNHPVLKGALVTGAISAVSALIFAKGADAALSDTSWVSGMPPARFP